MQTTSRIKNRIIFRGQCTSVVKKDDGVYRYKIGIGDGMVDCVSSMRVKPDRVYFVYGKWDDNVVDANYLQAEAVETAEVSGYRETISFLADCGLPADRISQIATLFYTSDGFKALHPEKTDFYADPFALYYALDLPYADLDMMLTALGIAKDDPRIKGALVVKVLRDAESRGDAYLSLVALKNRTEQEIADHTGDDPDYSDARFRDLINGAGDVKWLPEGQIIYDAKNKLVYLKQIYHAEENVAAEIAKRLSDPAPPFCFTPSAAAEDDLDPDQILAVERACTEPVSVITGGPGTGKTSVIKAVIRALRKKYPSIRIGLCAPTGKAAKRLSSQTGEQAQTLHRVICRALGTGRLCGDVVVIDETSMVPIKLLSALLDSVDQRSKLIFVGDVDQLPPIGAGNFLSEMIAEPAVPVTRLTTIHRQATDSAIPALAGWIRDAGQTGWSDRFPSNPVVTPGGTTGYADRVGSVIFIPVDPMSGDGDALDAVLHTYSSLRARGVDERDMTILTSYASKTRLNAHAINAEICKRDGRPKIGFAVGDRVIHTRNDYDLAFFRDPDCTDPAGKGVYNGDTGTISAISADDDIIVRLDDGTYVQYQSYMSGLSLAYAMTTHKAQGSEYDYVIIPVTGSQHFADRRLIYTAVTRARKKCIIIGGMQACISAIKKTDPQRNSSFPAHLAKAIGG